MAGQRVAAGDTSTRPAPSVLIAERDRFAADYAESILLEAGMHVVVALDVESAASLFKAGEFDLVIVESMISGGVGTGFMQSVKRERPVPVVLVSQDAASSGDEALRWRPDGYLHKPVDAGTMLDLVWELLQDDPRHQGA